MKYFIVSVSALLLLGGCSAKPEPEPEQQPVAVEVKKPKPKPKPVYHAPKKRGKVPPLPVREEDIDVDNAVDSAMGDIPA